MTNREIRINLIYYYRELLSRFIYALIMFSFEEEYSRRETMFAINIYLYCDSFSIVKKYMQRYSSNWSKTYFLKLKDLFLFNFLMKLFCTISYRRRQCRIQCNLDGTCQVPCWQWQSFALYTFCYYVGQQYLSFGPPLPVYLHCQDFVSGFLNYIQKFLAGA